MDKGHMKNGAVVEISPPDLRLRRNERAVTQGGHINIIPVNVEQRGLKYAKDIYSTLIDLNWGWTLLTFCAFYFGSWLLFAVAWHLILYIHGDFDPINWEKQKEGSWKPCITGIEDFTTSFLFSVETQHTTGYGFYQLTEECPDAIILLCLQSIVGVILEGLLVGMVFMKLSGAKNRAKTLMFSRNAVISLRDGKRYLMFRVADMRRTHLLEAHVRAFFVANRITEEGHVVRSSQKELVVQGEGETGSQVLLFWPTIILHEIDEASPLYNITQKGFEVDSRDFEIIVVLEGIMEATGITTQARSSYLPREILFGHSFMELKESHSKSNEGERLIDYSTFNDTILSPV